MPPEGFPIADYLARIGYAGPLEPAPSTLSALHRHQILAIPFENLDPLGGRPVSLEPSALVEKLIRQRRGGHCFELNGLFLLALNALGFRTRPLCARVLISPGHYGPRTHQITLMEFPAGPWLVDVGFGGNGLIEAIPFVADREFDHGHDRFRLVADAAYGHRLEHRLPNGWRTSYAFSLDPFLPADYRALNFFICRSPDSFFTRLPLCVRTTETERHIILANQYKIRPIGGPPTSRLLTTPEELRAVLTGPFKLPVPAELPLPTPQPPPPGTREI
jgi:N-hydroxyarylamine O-acetyltransferase